MLAAVAGTSAAADEYRALASDVAAEGTVPVMVTGWHAVTGDKLEAAGSAGGGMVAVTGDKFVESVDGAGGVSEVRRFEHLPVIAMRVDAAALAAAKSYGAGVQVWRDPPVRTFLADSGPMVGVSPVHRAGYTGKGTFVAVVDTGTDVGHPFIAGRPIMEACFAKVCPNGRARMVGPGAARPVDPHGTHVAGIALGRGKRFSGVAPEAGLITVNVFDRDGGAYSSNILAALDWIVGVAAKRQNRVASVNMSLGASVYFSQPCKDRIYDRVTKLLADLKVVVTAASGNGKKIYGIAYPACVKGIVSVGATDKKARVAGFSNSAPILDLLAPGVSILSAVPRTNNRGAAFEKLSGTSMATPHVAGALALLRQAAPEASWQELYGAMIKNGRLVADRRNGIVTPAIDVGRTLAELGGGQGSKDLPPKGESTRPAAPRDRTTEPARPKQGEWRSVGD